MLFYNHKQEFIGIDEAGLKLLNYTSLEDLLSVCGDVADLFAKEPGYIHNFKNFGWIDFLLHADSDATSAIVHAKGRTFSCTLSVQKLFLTADPASNGYIIDMTHVKSISGEEIRAHVTPPRAPQESIQAVPEVSKPETPSSLPDYAYLTPTLLSEPDTLDVPSFEDVELEQEVEPIGDFYPEPEFKIAEEEFPAEEISLPTAPVPSERPVSMGVRYTPAEQEFINKLKTDASYRFDPQVAADELGLPVDLIEEFIGDFIQQSHDFKDELFEAALKGDMNNLKILSHKLKGVAANLRIEDALETLSIINTSTDPVEIEANLKCFYAIIAKLEGKEVSDAPVPESQLSDLYPAPQLKEEAAPQPKAEADEDIYEFMLKQDDEPLVVEDEALFGLPDTQEEIIVEDLNVISEPASVVVDDLNDTPEAISIGNAEDTSTEEEPAALNEPENKLLYDTVANAGALGIELPFFQELLGDYKEEAIHASKRISDAIGAFDTHAWKKTAGELKGISDNLRLTQISEQLAILSQTNDAQEANKASKRLASFITQL